MIKKALLAASVATGLIVPAAQAGELYLPPKPAIVKPENIEFSKNMLLAMPFTLGLVAKNASGVAPSIASTATSQGATSNSTSHTVSYPSGIVSGNLLVAIIAVSGGSVLTMPSGWTAPVGITGAGGFTGRLNVSYKIADGSEGASFTATSAFSTGLCAVVHRITGNRPGIVTDTDLNTYGGTFASTASPNPAAVTPSWGSSNNLWIQSLTWSSRTITRTAAPSGYTLGDASTTSSSSANGIAMTTVARKYEGASEDAGAWTLSASALTVWLCTVIRSP